MTNGKTSVLVVDDDASMLRMMKGILDAIGFRVIVAESGEAALHVFEKETPDLVLLDIIMPDIDGYTVCRRIREFSGVPVIMLTSKSDEMDKVRGLDIGADDYVTKPFSALELNARIRAVLRRNGNQNVPHPSVFKLKDLVVDFSSRRVKLNKKDIRLTAIEYKILAYLCLNAGRVITSDQLLQNVWGEAYTGSHHLLQVNISRLRKKLGDRKGDSTYISTRPGIGYLMMKSG